MTEKGLTRRDLEETFVGFEKRQDEKFKGLEDRVDSRLSGLEARVDLKLSSLEERMDSRFKGLEERVDSKLTDVEERVVDQFHIIAEGLNDQIKLLAEGHTGVVDRLKTIDERLERMEKEGERQHLETRALIKLSYTELDRRLSDLELEMREIKEWRKKIEARFQI